MLTLIGHGRSVNAKRATAWIDCSSEEIAKGRERGRERKGNREKETERGGDR